MIHHCEYRILHPTRRVFVTRVDFTLDYSLRLIGLAVTQEIKCDDTVFRGEIFHLRFEGFGGLGPSMEEEEDRGIGPGIGVIDLVRVEIEERHCLAPFCAWGYISI